MDTRKDDQWKAAALRLAQAKDAKDQGEKEYRAALDAATLIAPDGAKGYGVILAQVVSKGRVAYAKAVAALMPNADLEPWRGKESLSYRVTTTGEES